LKKIIIFIALVFVSVLWWCRVVCNSTRASSCCQWPIVIAPIRMWSTVILPVRHRVIYD